MNTPRTILGVMIGLVVAAVVLAFVGTRQAIVPPTGPMISEKDGHIRELVMHYEPSSKDIVLTAYREFLGALEADVTVHMVCPHEKAFSEIVELIGPTKCRIAPIIVNHQMTTWSRDRWAALAPNGAGPTTVWSPREEASAELWPARAGDSRVGEDIASALAPSVAARRSSIFFDAGDFLCDGERVFVMPRLLARNIGRTVADEKALLSYIEKELKRPVVMFREAPDHHVGMVIASVGDNTMLVGDPSLAKGILDAYSRITRTTPSSVAFASLPQGADFSEATQKLFDSVAAQCEELGYKVVRIPVVPAGDGRTYITYVNALIDQQDGKRIVYMPVYRSFALLNKVAQETWERLGYDVRPIDCTSVFRHFGSLHCLVNVLMRW